VDRQDRAGRQNIDVLGLDLFAIARVDDWHSRRSAEYLGKHAVAIWRQVGEDHERQPAAGWKRFEKLLQRLDPARRGTNADDRKAGHHDIHPSSLRGFDPTPRLHPFKRMFGASVPNAARRNCFPVQVIETQGNAGLWRGV